MYLLSDQELLNFVKESNRIEGILREPTPEELAATIRFLGLLNVTTEDLVELVQVYQPDAVLRDKKHLNVRVGNHIAPQGGPRIRVDLAELLDGIHLKDPWKTHLAYEMLHPFTDGNGRSGRALWAWRMLGRQPGLPLGFLHHFYYQTLGAQR